MPAQERQELRFLRHLLAASLDVICAFDAEGRFLYASQAAFSMWGYAPEELIGLRYIDLVCPEDRAKTGVIAEAIMAGVNVTNFENRYTRKDGSLLPVVWSATWDKAEQVMYGIAKDATEKKELEERAQKSKRLFETFMNHSPITGWITDENCIMHYMNDLYLKTYGFTEADFGRNIYDMFPSQLAVDYHLNNLQVIRGGKTIETTEKARLPNGTEQVLKIFKFPIVVDGVKMAAAWAADISEQMELEQELAKSVQRYHYVNEATSDAIFEWDIERNHVQRGPGFTRIFGRQLTTVPFENSILPEDKEKVSMVINTALKDPLTDRYQVSYRYRHEGGHTIYLFVRAFILREKGKAVKIIGSVQDVTNQTRLQQQLLAQEKEAKRQVVKSVVETEEKERRMFSVHLHDNINQRLTSCKLMLDLADDAGEQATALLQKTRRELNEVISEIRKISYDLNPSVLHDLSLVDAIRQLIESAGSQSLTRITFTAEDCGEPTAFRKTDRIAIYRIVQEQLHYILQSTGATYAHMRLRKCCATMQLSLEDDGAGVDTASIQAGSALANIQNRVAYYQGTLTVSAQPGVGTKMEITVPLD